HALSDQQGAEPPHTAHHHHGTGGPPHQVLRQQHGQAGPLHGGAPGRRHQPRRRPQRTLPDVGQPRLLHPPVEPGEQDVHPGVHGAPEEVRGVHPRRGVPPVQVLHRQRRGGRSRQGLR
ncbi:hypothetical protein CRUP_015416, partial [Coryphaenoides rupestris]